MTVQKHNGRRRSVAIVAANLAALAIGIQAARMPAVASGTHAVSERMAGMTLGAQAGAVTHAGPVSMLHRHLVRVTIVNYAFSPARLIVSPGTRIVWTNKDGDPHTVHGTATGWSSEALDTGGSYARTFSKSGSFAYYCGIHPFMHGTITVKN